MLHPDLQKLLDYALESGEVTEKHRQILHNKAIALNQDIDELDMIIEGEVNRLKKTKENQKQPQTTCPNCGNSIPNTAIKCGFCGFEVTKTRATGENYIEKLKQELEKVDKWHSEAKMKDKWGLKSAELDLAAAQQKASIISTFTMPNDKEHLLEFFHFCHGNFEGNYSSRFILFGVERLAQKNINFIAKAYQGKAKSAYEKLKRFVNEDEDINKVVNQFNSKYDI